MGKFSKRSHQYHIFMGQGTRWESEESGIIESDVIRQEIVK